MEGVLMTGDPEREDPFQDLPDWLVLIMIVLFLIGAAIVLYL